LPKCSIPNDDWLSKSRHVNQMPEKQTQFCAINFGAGNALPE